MACVCSVWRDCLKLHTHVHADRPKHASYANFIFQCKRELDQMYICDCQTMRLIPIDAMKCCRLAPVWPIPEQPVAAKGTEPVSLAAQQHAWHWWRLPGSQLIPLAFMSCRIMMVWQLAISSSTTAVLTSPHICIRAVCIMDVYLYNVVPQILSSSHEIDSNDVMVDGAGHARYCCF